MHDMKDFVTITMSGTEYPLFCSMEVLSQIQDEFGDWVKFIEKLLPDASERPDGFMPDIHALIFSLPKLVNEGIESYNLGRPIEERIDPIPARRVFLICDQPVITVVSLIKDAVLRSIIPPKEEPHAESPAQD